MFGQRRDPSSLLPLLPSAFHILLALAQGERYGYRIAKQVESSTGGSIKLGPGTLYRQLKQMAVDGWIVESERDDGEDRRRYYELTGWGRQIAEAEAARLESVVRLARSCRLLPALGSAP